MSGFVDISLLYTRYIVKTNGLVVVVVVDLFEMMTKRKLVLYPLRMSELSHPGLLDVIPNCLEFKTSFVQGVGTQASPASRSWTG